MYNTSKVAEIIKEVAKNKGHSIATMLKECGLGKDTINTMARRGSWVQADSLAKIADFLDCSVDYLLGRTANPQSHKNNAFLSVGNVSSNSGAIGVGNTVTNNAEPKDAGRILLLELFSNLSPNEQAQLLSQIITKNFTSINPQQPETNAMVKYRIDTNKMSKEEREKIIKYLQSYSCTLVNSVKSYMVFDVEPGFDIEGMLAAKGWEAITPKKISD